MSLTKLTENLNTIQGLADKPSETASQLKEKFDEAGNKIKTYINSYLTEELDSIVSTLQNGLTTAQLNAIYPVGAIYMSANNTSPATLFGGTWEQIKDKFLLSAGDTYSAGATGGEATHTLTTEEIPAHTHGSKGLTGTIDFRRYGSNDSNTDIVPGRSGIVSITEVTWSGSHAYIDAKNNMQNNPIINRATINATHEHNSVGGGTAHNNMPPYLAVYVWKRVS